jgi:hypothetical protein
LVKRYPFSFRELTRFLQERRLKPQRKITLLHDIPPNRSIAAPGNRTSIPNRSVTGRKSRRLNVTIASAWAVHRHFEHHVIIRIAQRRSPQKWRANRLADGCNRIEQYAHVLRWQLRGHQVLRSRDHGLIFDHERYRDYKSEPLLQCLRRQALEWLNTVIDDGRAELEPQYALEREVETDMSCRIAFMVEIIWAHIAVGEIVSAAGLIRGTPLVGRTNPFSTK